MNTMLGVFLALVTAPAAPPAVLTADQATVDRGEIKAGPMLKQTFRVTNTGAEAVSITKLESGCGCVRRSVSKNDLKPGDSAEVAIDVNTLTQPDGPHAWLLKLQHRPASAAKTAPDEVLELRLTAKLSHDVTVSPPMVSISTEVEAATTVTLTDSRRTPLTVSKVVSSSPHLAVKLRQPMKPGDLIVDVAVAAEMPVGTHDETLTVYTTDPAYAELQIPARIVKRAKNAVTAHPESLDLIDTAGLVQFRRAGAKPVAIASAECSTAGVTVTASSGSGTVGTIKVVVSEKAGASGKADVKVKFTEPEGAEVVVPVRWGN
ncbi:hypothetical protein PX52LOC_07422 [Limnoglobus roseus]|uniref:DUF1573 domain-containing protein n=2 Tax=Limnoglobus roseus TaxID=2598579 RepID=A0A5C1ALP0_9BACT|nr:hypothetical protein PX52LOC_07422 [Limnoglobus roseus]